MKLLTQDKIFLMYFYIHKLYSMLSNIRTVKCFHTIFCDLRCLACSNLYRTTTTSHCYITLRDTSLKFFSFSVISKTSSSFSSPHFGQLVRYSDTYNNGRFSLEGKLYFDI